MLRTALTPRWLGLLCLVIAVNIGFGILGRWQLDVAREKGVVEATQEAAAKPPAPLTQVIAPGGTFPSGGLDRSVTLVGTYDADKQLLVTGRRLGDREGFWVVTPLAVEGATGRIGGDALIPVLRGFVTDPASAPGPPAGRVSLTGTLAQSEPPPNQFRAMPDGQVQTINVPALINRWDGDIFNAFVFLGTQDPPTSGLAHVAPPTPGVAALNWRNLGYALQWFFFGGFTLYMWWRMVSEDARAQALAAAPNTAVAAASAADTIPAPIRSDATRFDATRADATRAGPAVPAIPIEQGDIFR